MNYYRILLSVSLAAILWGCAVGGKSVGEIPQTPPPVAPSEEEFLGQNLPIGAEVEIGGKLIELEVAATPQEQSLGLMYRTSLADNRGMLFPFSPPRPVSFWMKNCRISLDMIFLLNGEVQEIAAHVPPCTEEPCPTYGPGRGQIVDAVIELRAGRAAELGLKPGDRLEVRRLESPGEP
ncbi:MAG TPA: DUF192 domain-containing protein [Oscillatoriaceae cyanobacterium M33_DOE_052]|uniref:DUF192 domain-containing protein n=1 Tax=Planktothricoides sp. SpSt-374 TaxID=2282167 RepID=A0A7C3VJT2_9CYAN|nr:DUF192 domain-containing protein [Oscillatoriaceae cyanobacterium M33_DOE_052]